MAVPITFVTLLGTNLHNSPFVQMIQRKLTLIGHPTSIIATKEVYSSVHSWEGQ